MKETIAGVTVPDTALVHEATALVLDAHLAPEAAVVTLGVETDVLGLDLDRIGVDQRAVG